MIWGLNLHLHWLYIVSANREGLGNTALIRLVFVGHLCNTYHYQYVFPFRKGPIFGPRFGLGKSLIVYHIHLCKKSISRCVQDNLSFKACITHHYRISLTVALHESAHKIVVLITIINKTAHESILHFHR